MNKYIAVATMVVVLWLAGVVCRAGDDARTEKILAETTLPEVSFDEMHVMDAIQVLAVAADVNVIFSDEVQKSDLTISLSLGNRRSVLDILKIMNRQLDNALSVRVEGDGFLLVGMAKEAVEAEYEVVIYDLSALQFEVAEFPGPKMDLSNNSYDPWEEIVIGPGSNTPKVMEKDEVANMVEVMTGGDSWENGVAHIELKGSLLIVKQTPEVHKEIRDLFAEFATK